MSWPVFISCYGPGSVLGAGVRAVIKVSADRKFTLLLISEITLSYKLSLNYFLLLLLPLNH